MVEMIMKIKVSIEIWKLLGNFLESMQKLQLYNCNSTPQQSMILKIEKSAGVVVKI